MTLLFKISIQRPDWLLLSFKFSHVSNNQLLTDMDLYLEKE